MSSHFTRLFLLTDVRRQPRHTGRYRIHASYTVDGWDRCVELWFAGHQTCRNWTLGIAAMRNMSTLPVFLLAPDGRLLACSLLRAVCL